MKLTDLLPIEMELVKIKPQSFEGIELPPLRHSARIEIRATEDIDCGVMSERSYKLFAKADSDKGIKKAIWVEETISAGFSFDIGNHPNHFLVLFNAYQENSVFVAYAVVGA